MWQYSVVSSEGQISSTSTAHQTVGSEQWAGSQSDHAAGLRQDNAQALHHHPPPPPPPPPPLELPRGQSGQMSPGRSLLPNTLRLRLHPDLQHHQHSGQQGSYQLSSIFLTRKISSDPVVEL